MAALTITAANVAYVSGPVEHGQQAGEAFIAGAMLYYGTDGLWRKAQSDGTAVEAGSLGIGMALATADAAGARVSVARPGAVVTVGTGTAGEVYIVSDTAGSVWLRSDAGTTDKVTVAAQGIGSSQLQLLHGYNAGAVLA